MHLFGRVPNPDIMIIDYYWLGERPLRRRLPDREMTFASSCRLANGSGQQEVQGSQPRCGEHL